MDKTISRTNRFLAAAAAVVILGTGVTALMFSNASSSNTDESASSARFAGVGGVPVTTLSPGELPADAPADAPATNDGNAPGGQGQGQGGGQAQPPAAPGVLAVSKNQVDLADGVFVGSVDVRNDGESPIDWHWAGDPRVSVSQSGGTLGAGESTTVYFTVDNTVFPAGDFALYNCVYNDDAAKDVLITGKKLIKVNPGIQLPNPQIKPNN